MESSHAKQALQPKEAATVTADLLITDEVEHVLSELEAGTTDLVPRKELAQKLASGRELIVKLGVDPTSPDLHLGHAVPLRKMRQFQDLGHKGVLVIGNGTARIGDPSGRNATRPTLSQEEIENNAKTYVEQAFKVLDPNRTQVVFNDTWIGPLDLSKMLELMSSFTVARVLERDDFAKRYAAHQSISLHEFIYPVLQAYDSVVIKADVELGGSDQIFNLLAGRELMQKMDMEPQVALTMPLLVGTDGAKKMSKSTGNYIGLTDEPADMYGKVMSIPDELIVEYYRYASNLSAQESVAIEAGLAQQSLNPYELKHALAKNIVSIYHGDAAATAAEKNFINVFKKHERPSAQELSILIPVNDEGLVYVPALLVDAGLCDSRSAARRSIDSGAVKIDDVALEKGMYNVEPQLVTGAFVQVGKRNAVQLV